MERISKSIGKRIRGVKIYAEGLEEIIDVLSREGGEVEITTDQYKFDNLDECLRKYENTGNIDEINLQISDPYVGVQFRENEIWLFASDSNALSIGIYEQVDGILKKWTPKTAILKNGWYLVVLYMFGTVFFKYGDRVLNKVYFEVSVSLLATGIIAWIAYYCFAQLPRFNKMGYSSQTR